MTDTLSRLAGPTTPSRSDAGSTIYDPSAGVIAVKNAIFTNRDPLRGCWAYLSKGDLTNKDNLFVPGLYVPPGGIVPVELDFIMDGTVDDIRAKQVVDMSYTRFPVTNMLTATTFNSTTDGTGFTTASWTEKNGYCYLMCVVSTHATAAAAPTSFTDTHTGITWTKIGTEIIQNGASVSQCISFWRAQSTGTTATTTTATFGATMTGCHITIIEFQGDTSGTNGSETFTDGGTFTGSSVTQTAVTGLASWQMGGRFAAIASTAGGASTAGAGFTEVYDAAIATPTHMVSTEYALSPGATADFTLATTSTEKILALVGIQDGTKALNVTLNGVVVT